MSVRSSNYLYLAPNPKSGYRQLFVKGTRIPARVLYGWYACEEPMTPAQIATDYDLPVEAVKEAIAYCESGPPELLEDLKVEEKLMEALGMNAAGYKRHGKPKRLSPQERLKLDRR